VRSVAALPRVASRLHSELPVGEHAAAVRQGWFFGGPLLTALGEDRAAQELGRCDPSKVRILSNTHIRSEDAHAVGPFSRVPAILHARRRRRSWIRR
jgi:hypothetical protein